MIITLLLNIVYVFALGIVTLISTFGDVSQNSAITTGISTMAEYYMSLNDYLPISTILAIIAFDLVFELGVFTYKLVRWGYQKVPTIS